MKRLIIILLSLLSTNAFAQQPDTATHSALAKYWIDTTSDDGQSNEGNVYVGYSNPNHFNTGGGSVRLGVGYSDSLTIDTTTCRPLIIRTYNVRRQPHQIGGGAFPPFVSGTGYTTVSKKSPMKKHK